jgi:hypothetical protein
MRTVRITQASDYDLVGDLVDETPARKKKIGLRIVR